MGTTRKREAATTFPSTGQPEFWRDRSRIDRTDWISLIDAADTALQRLRAVQPSSLGRVMTGPGRRSQMKLGMPQAGERRPADIAKLVVS